MLIIKKIKKFFKEDYVVVYQMGKVGSRSVIQSLENAGINNFSMHSFKKHIIFTQFNKYNSTKYYLTIKKRLRYRIRLTIIRLLLFLKKKNIKIISLVREPISRNVSFYFQDIQIPIMDIHKNIQTIKSSEISIDALINDFKSKFNHFSGINWFDREFYNILNIDVYENYFNPEAGYGVFKDKGFDVMIIQLECLNDLEKEIAEFINSPLFELSKENSSNIKWYNDVYKRFLKEIDFDKEYVNSMMDNKFMKHFYTKEDIDMFRNKYQ